MLFYHHTTNDFVLMNRMRTKSTMKHLRNISLSKRCLLILFGSMPFLSDGTEADDHRARYQETLDNCVYLKESQLAGWDRLTAAMYYKTEWLRKCQLEASGVLQTQLDIDYSEGTTVDLKFRKQLDNLEQIMKPSAGQEMAGQLGFETTLIRANSDSTGRSSGTSDAPAIRTLSGYSTQTGR